MNNSLMPKSYKLESKPHLFCPGCGHAMILKHLGFFIDERKLVDKISFVIDIGCSLLAWNFYDVSTVQAHHGRSIPVATGIKFADPENPVIAYTGDGGAYAIGLQSLIHAAYRNDPITVIVVNNTNYAMTGGQMAPTTIVGEKTTTSPSGKNIKYGDHFLGPELVKKTANKSAYLTRTSVSNPNNFKKVFGRAIDNNQSGNFSMIEILSLCPTNWKTNAEASFSTLTSFEKLYPLGEIKAER